MIEKTTSGSTHALEAKRKIHLSRLPGPEDGATLGRAPGKVDGVRRVSANSSKVWVEVDHLRTKTDDQTLERVVAEAGWSARTGWWPRLESGWY